MPLSSALSFLGWTLTGLHRSSMVPSCLRSVLSSRKLALAGLGWSTCVRVGPFQLSSERGPSGPELVLSGLT